MNKRTVLNWLSLSGLIATIFYALYIIEGTKNYPGYNWIQQAVSDLTAIEAPSYIAASRYTSIYGSLSCLCCLVIYILIKDKEIKLFRIGIVLYTIMNWISFIGYTLFPLSSSGYKGTFQDIMHCYVVTVYVVILSIASLILIFIGGIKNRKHIVVGILAIISLFSISYGSIGMGIFPKEYFGLFERLSVFSVVIFTGILGMWGFSMQND